MKKIKLLFSVIALSVLFNSCSKEESIPSDEELSIENVLKFSSEDEMQDKITEIENFKKNQEAEIMQKILERNNLEEPIFDGTKSFVNTKISKIDKEALIEDVTFYHQQKLKAIYAEREYFGFTSIQSIADEINFSKLLNPELSQKLNSEYSNLFCEKNNQTLSVYNGLSNVLIPNTELYIKDRLIDLEDYKISYLNSENNNNESKLILDEGIVATGHNNFMAITFTTSVGASILRFDLGPNWYETNISNSIACMINIGTGYVLYPCYFYITPGSTSVFNTSTGNTNYPLSFLSGVSSALFRNQTIFTLNFPAFSSTFGSVGGSFAIPTSSNELLWAYGSINF